MRELFSNLKDEKAAYVMTQQSVQVDSTRSAMAVPQVRLFRRDPAVRWQYRVHEQILLSIRAAGHDLRWTDIAILHDGYQDPMQCRTKLERNVRLLQIQNAENPDDPIILYHLGWAYEQLGRPDDALTSLRRSLEKTPADYSIRPKLYVLLGRGHHRLGQRAEALASCRAGRQQFPDDVELPFLEGILLYEQGDLAAAESCFLQVLKIQPGQRFTSMDAGLRGHKAWHQLALIYRSQGRRAEADALWREILAEHPTFWPARNALKELEGT
jgi:tetratricopeptide (TPR) repeat protein